MEIEPQVLLNEDGTTFDGLEGVVLVLEQLNNDEREAYRNGNAAAISASRSNRLLVVAGPGTGKSQLFLGRIEHWVGLGGSDKIRVVSFVRKLVGDLKTSISARIAPDQKGRIQVTTLHTLALSIVDHSGGTSAQRLGPSVRVIDANWAWTVWEDVLEFHPKLRGGYHLDTLRQQFWSEAYDDSSEWKSLRSTYSALCAFFNAVGFEYLIVLARAAVEEKPDLVDAALWIVDEYQDFNASEDHLVRSLTERASSVLLAGDDDQTLYQAMKGSHPEILRGYYFDGSYANGMLPFCGRSTYYICQTAASFISTHRPEGGIPKIFLPVKKDESARRVRIVATATPATAVAYIKRFLVDHKTELAAYMERRDPGKDTDPFLLILTPGGKDWLAKCNYDDLNEILIEYGSETPAASYEYISVVLYARAGWRESDNFAVRKVLQIEGLSTGDVHNLITEALARGSPLIVVVDEKYAGVADRIRKVAAMVEKYADDAAEMVAQLAQLIDVMDSEALAEEIRRKPIRRSTRVDDKDEPVETAGLLPAVAQMTIFASKGLSAHHVIVLGCDDVNMSKLNDLAFFVALTRARESLHLVVAAKSGGAKVPHRFVFDLPPNCCEYVSFTKTSGVVTPLNGASGLRKYFEKLAWARSQY